MFSQQKRQVGRTALELPMFGIGMCPLGELFEEIDEDVAQETLAAAWQAGVRYYDAAPGTG